jgi:hypothetical protein
MGSSVANDHELTTLSLFRLEFQLNLKDPPILGILEVKKTGFYGRFPLNPSIGLKDSRSDLEWSGAFRASGPPTLHMPKA